MDLRGVGSLEGGGEVVVVLGSRDYLIEGSRS